MHRFVCYLCIWFHRKWHGEKRIKSNLFIKLVYHFMKFTLAKCTFYVKFPYARIFNICILVGDPSFLPPFPKSIDRKMKLSYTVRSNARYNPTQNFDSESTSIIPRDWNRKLSLRSRFREACIPHQVYIWKPLCRRQWRASRPSALWFQIFALISLRLHEQRRRSVYALCENYNFTSNSISRFSILSPPPLSLSRNLNTHPIKRLYDPAISR